MHFRASFRAIVVDPMLRTLLSLLVPPRCLACGATARDVLCAACRAAMPWLRDACPRCALPRPCAPCPAARQRFAAAFAPVVYEGPAKALVHALKFHAHLAAAEVMAAQMAATLLPRTEVRTRAEALARAQARAVAGAPLVPVPFAPSRRRERGFDPADLLARGLSERTGRPVARCLRRAGTAPRQVGSARGARLRPGGVVVAAGRAPPPPAVILVDDVHTTGATLDACAAALRAAGTRTVVAITYARTARRA